MIKGSVDRIEGDIAVIILEDKTVLNVCTSLKEGDLITIDSNGLKKIDNSNKKEKMKNLQNKILKRGDIL